MILGLLNVGPLELLIIAAAAVMLFGGDLPETARKAARMVVRLRALAADLGREFSSATGSTRPFRTADELRRLAGLDDSPTPITPTHGALPAPPPTLPARDPAVPWRPQTLSPPAEFTSGSHEGAAPGDMSDAPAPSPPLPEPPPASSVRPSPPAQEPAAGGPGQPRELGGRDLGGRGPGSQGVGDSGG